MNETVLWSVFAAVVVPAFAVDLWSHRQDKEVGAREAALWSFFWILLAMSYGMLFSWRGGHAQVLEYFTAYFLEKSLSIDNLFVFSVAFTWFTVQRKFRYRILFWGVIGAILTRALFIAGGVALVQKFSWTLYIFGVVLIVASVKMAFFTKNHTQEVRETALVRFARRIIPVTEHWAHEFIVLIEGKIHLTPAAIVLLTIESTDVLFAFDSVPAIFGVSQDPLIIFTSNIFAVLGLRSLYFLLENLLNQFRFLSTGVNVILTFIGVKLLLHGFVHVPTIWTLFIISFILIASIVVSLALPKNE